MEIKDHTCLADAINIKHQTGSNSSLKLRSHDMTNFFVELQWIFHKLTAKGLFYKMSCKKGR